MVLINKASNSILRIFASIQTRRSLGFTLQWLSYSRFHLVTTCLDKCEEYWKKNVYWKALDNFLKSTKLKNLSRKIRPKHTSPKSELPTKAFLGIIYTFKCHVVPKISESMRQAFTKQARNERNNIRVVSTLCKPAAPSLHQDCEMDWTNCSEQGLHKTSWKNGSTDIDRCWRGTPKM